MKRASRGYSGRLRQEILVVRWGHFGTPVLLFPTAGGDAEEVERFHLIGALGHLIEAGRIKVYSCDSVAGRTWIDNPSVEYCAWMQNQFDSFVYHELVPAISQDCRTPGIEIITAGASMGAFNAVASLCRHPDVFRLAIGMSGFYDLENYAHGHVDTGLYFASPMHFIPNLNQGDQLEALRRRFVLMAYGKGRWEHPDQSWRMADVLGSKGIDNRVDAWGPEYDHDWPSWRAMVPHYLNELT
ncbi:MAG: esterase family protein [Acidobacteriota bacterium]